MKAKLTPDVVAALLRACVTVVKPGQTLIVRVPVRSEPPVVARYQERLNTVIRDQELGFAALVLPAEELAVAESQA
jgi:hypothetical protein